MNILRILYEQRIRNRTEIGQIQKHIGELRNEELNH